MGALDCVTKGVSVTDSTEVFKISSNLTLNESRRDLESQQTPSTTSHRRFWKWRLFCDIPLLIIILLLTGLFELGVIPSYRAGFYCNDPKLSFPFTGDTVSMVTVMVGVIVIPVVVFWVTELFFVDSSTSMRGKLLQVTRRTGWLVLVYQYGMIFNLSLVEVMKGITGSPRPNFFDVCQPDTNRACGNSTNYITTFKCTSRNFSTYYQNDSFRSFPSGHASLGVYAGFFLTWYLQARVFRWSNRSVLLVPFLQLTFMSLAAVCALTRITDNRHHWWDVLVGVIIGFATVYYAVKVLFNDFSYMKPDTTTNTSEQNQVEKTPILNGRREDASPTCYG
ncbi:phospholipid phosphatase 2-like [Achroia grisella]|uniref:phospholipid phosphatase 2-like n=1 Tax=Achroia grisella TaxID=688607 RepID=UPI0027D28CD4|nr:phospholipid phosphatase 2-like [Achroia grisella]